MTLPETRTPRRAAWANAIERTESGSVIPAAPARNERTPEEDKRLSTLLAAFALRGHSVHELADGGFITTRWSGLHRHCPDLDSLEAFARQVGAIE